MQAKQVRGSLVENLLAWFTTTIGRVVVALIVPLVTFLVLWQGYIFLRDTNAPKLVVALIAIIWGVGGVALLYYATNFLVEKMPKEWTRRLQPFIFIGPALAILAWFLFLPTLRTLYLSMMSATGFDFVWFKNYVFALTDRIMLEAFRNNLIWMILGTGLSVGLGLIIAVLADRSKFEKVYKAIIFMPMAISFVGAGVIWKFVYAYRGEGIGIQEIGLLNAIVMAFGAKSQPWLLMPPWNNFFLIVIMVWLQTGYAMVIISSAIKGIPAELLEAARVDGATEVQVFFRIIIPTIQGTLLTVATTIIIFSLKLFDIVRVMTGGNNGTNVIANEFYIQQFTYNNSGRASAIAIILLLAVVPVMIYNLRQFRERKAFS
jgi:alpha-glucoside transport system permease protein